MTNWRTIHTVLLLLLILVNLGLFWANRMEMDRLYSASDEELERVLALYDRENIQVDAVLRREGYPKAPAILGGAGFLTTELVEKFLGTEYRTAYMDARQRRYTKGEESILLDPEGHRFVYTGTLKAESVEELAARCLSGWICTEYEENRWVYVQKKEDLYLYYNRAEFLVSDEGQITLELQYYEPLGYETTTREVRPLDELMYGALREILLRSPEGAVLQEIRYGYDLNSYRDAVYCLEFALDNGKTVRINAYSGEILN